MSIRQKMHDSATPYLRPDEPVQAVIGAQTASQYVAAVAGLLFFLGINRYRMIVVTPQRMLVLDCGTRSIAKARGTVAEIPRRTVLGPPAGLWHVIPVNGEKLRVHRRFFPDIETADAGA